MKKDIHPDYKVCTISCACGNEFQTKSNVESLRIDICSSCHPFFTGEQNLLMLLVELRNPKTNITWLNSTLLCCA